MRQGNDVFKPVVIQLYCSPSTLSLCGWEKWKTSLFMKLLPPLDQNSLWRNSFLQKKVHVPKPVNWNSCQFGVDYSTTKRLYLQVTKRFNQFGNALKVSLSKNSYFYRSKSDQAHLIGILLCLSLLLRYTSITRNIK